MKTRLLWSGAALLAFVVGLLVGRRFPAHRYVKFGESRYILDTTTGTVCDPVKEPLTNPKDPLAVFDKAQSPLPVPPCPVR